MRRLVLVRHAKSAWDAPDLDDHDRPLARRGEQALPKIRAHIATLDLPRLMVRCSTARRARDTFEGIRPALPDDAEIEFDRSVYDADAADLLDMVRAVADGVESVMLVGHNPAMQDLAVGLVGAGEVAPRAQLAAKVPTGSVVSMWFDASWPQLTPGDAVLRDLFMPRRPRP